MSHQASEVDVVEGADSVGEDNSVQREEGVSQERNDDNPRPAQRARFITYPHDEYVRETLPFRAFTETAIAALEKDNAAFQRLNFRYIDVLILRLIVSNKQGQANIYGQRKNNNSNNISAVRFTRFWLVKQMNSEYVEENKKLAYLMESRNMNVNLWKKMLNNRDNGAISIRSVIRIACPMPIDSYMKNDICMLNTHQPCILMRYPEFIDTVKMNPDIESNTSFAFVHNNAILTINQSALLKTTCTGKMCVRQRVSDWNNLKGCGCVGMDANGSSLVVQHSISIDTCDRGFKSYQMREFSSLKFSNLYLTAQIPGAVKLYIFQLTEAYVRLMEAIDECIGYVNRNGGFTVVGWYKRGVINNKTLVAGAGNNSNHNNSDKVQIDAGEISYHIVQIIPTNRSFLRSGSLLQLGLNRRKFNVNEIEEPNDE